MKCSFPQAKSGGGQPRAGLVVSQRSGTQASLLFALPSVVVQGFPPQRHFLKAAGVPAVLSASQIRSRRNGERAKGTGAHTHRPIAPTTPWTLQLTVSAYILLTTCKCSLGNTGHPNVEWAASSLCLPGEVSEATRGSQRSG